jgi:Asp-tRNA(Asn)/Glu-tRNA(Gln) amidotransferase A subunit family amidase
LQRSRPVVLGSFAGVNELVKWPASRMASAVREREVSPVELVEAHIARIEERNGELNAIVIPRFEDALVAARAAERGLSDGSAGPLHGVPFTVKDGIPVAGLPNPMGVKKLAGEVARKDAAAVCSLRSAGAILLGKTNVSEFLVHYDAVNSLFGATHNPHDPSRTAGGSSGGEAAALASGMSPCGLGSDLGGSIRFPAHCNGVFGFKPSRFTVPSADHFPVSGAGMRSFGTIGPLARSAEDLDLLLSVLATRRANSDPDAFPPREVTEPTHVAAAFEEDGLQPVSAECRAAVRQAADVLAEAGHEILWEAPPAMAAVRETYGAILGVEIATILLPLMKETLSETSPAYVRELVEQMDGLQPSAAYVEAFARLSDLERDAAWWHERRSITIAPVAPSAAPPLIEGFTTVDGQPTAPGGKLTLCTYANTLGLPAVSVPVARSAEGLPIAVQLIGPRGRDLMVLGVARRLEEALGGWIDPDESPVPREQMAW